MPNYPTGKIFPNYRGKWFKRENNEGLQIVRVWLYAATGRGVARILSYLSFALLAFWGVIRTHGVDFVFVESPPIFLGLTGWLASKFHRAKFILNISDLWPDSVVALGIMPASVLWPMFILEKFLYRKAWLVSATTRGIVRRLIEDKGVVSDKALYLPNGADLKLFSPRQKDEALLKNIRIAPDTKIFLYAGIHGYAQRLETVVEVATMVKRPDIHFLFVGDGPEKRRLQKMVQQTHLSNITFLPAQPTLEMPRYFSLATASIVPLMKAELFYDAFPSKLVVSLACGVPPIFSGDGEAAQLLQNEQCGVAVAPEDPTALKNAIEQLAGKSELRNTFAINARNLAERQFAWERVVGTWLTAVHQKLSFRHN
jgi:colanic acid biosynthesis glycosyl transferase WcaI